MAKKTEIEKHDSIFTASIHRAAEAFFAVKAEQNIHYDYEYQLLSAFLNSVVFTAARDAMRTDICGIITALVFVDKLSGSQKITCAAMAAQSREQNINLAKGALDFWRVAPWMGELGIEGELHGDKYPTAGEDIEAGDPMELIGNRFYVHRDMKKAILEKEQGT